MQQRSSRLVSPMHNTDGEGSGCLILTTHQYLVTQGLPRARGFKSSSWHRYYHNYSCSSQHRRLGKRRGCMNSFYLDPPHSSTVIQAHDINAGMTTLPQREERFAVVRSCGRLTDDRVGLAVSLVELSQDATNHRPDAKPFPVHFLEGQRTSM